MDSPKRTVEQSYDEIADPYLTWVQSQTSPRQRYTTRVLENAPKSPRILELGCGAGVPITRMLLDHGAQVVANDISAKQISLAKERCPTAELIQGDMMSLSFESESFDGAVSFYAIFHLPRSEQKVMLERIYGWLKPGSLLAFNLGTEDGEECHGEFLGRGMFWSNQDIESSKTMVKEVGFEIVDADSLEAGDGKLDESDPDYGVKFLWIVARKITTDR